MRPIPIEEYHSILLNIMKAFQKYSNEQDIPFFVNGGTAIGAIRHKGFIPWDDDIDLFIYKRDFERLGRLAEEKPFIDQEKRYKLLLPGVTPNYSPFFKIIDTKTVVYEKNISKKYATGVWVDVFCLSYWNDNLEEAKKQFQRQQYYKRMNKIIIGGHYRDTKYKIMEVVAAPVRGVLLLLGKDSSYWCRKIIENDNCKQGEYAGNVCWPFSFEKEHYRAEWFSDLIDVPFEDTTCPIERDYDQVLRNFYGDYMIVPPKEKRIRHNPEAYYLD